jgi:hypothetical protein
MKQENETILTHVLVTNKLSGSFLSINTNNFSINDPVNEYREYRNRVNMYIKIFREHVFEKDHPFNIVSLHFSSIFAIYIQNCIKEIYIIKSSTNPNAGKEIEIICNNIIKVLQKFIIEFQTALRLMYVKTISYNCFVEEKDEFINLATSLIISQGRLYNKLYELFEVVLDDQIKTLELRFNDFKNIKPEDLGIHHKFCLNDKTLTFQKQLLEVKNGLRISTSVELNKQYHILI